MRTASRHAGRQPAVMAFLMAALAAATTVSEAEPLRVGVYQNSPKVFWNGDGRAQGLFVDIFDQIARNEGWSVTYVPGTWLQNLERLESGEIDAVLDMAHTEERARRYDLNAIPIIEDWLQAFSLDTVVVNSIAELDGKRIAILTGSAGERYLAQEAKSQFKIVFSLQGYPDYAASVKALEEGRADLIVASRFFYFSPQRSDRILPNPVLFFPTPVHLGFTKGRHRPLVAKIDKNLADMKNDPGSAYYRSFQRWLDLRPRTVTPVYLRWLLPAGSALILLAAGLVLVLAVRSGAKTRQALAADLARRQSEQKYRDLVEFANSIILRWTHDGRITFLNEYGQRFFGYSAAEIVGRHVMGTIVPAIDSRGEDLGRLMDRICSDPAAYEQSVNENVKRSGERVWIAWTNRIVRDESGRVAEILSVGTDITERRRAEAELDQYRRRLEDMVRERTAELAVAKERAESADRLKSAFLATMSHELRTPLNSIIGFSGIMLQGLAGPLNQEQKKQLGMVQNSANHLLALINDVLDISKIEAGQLEVFPERYDLRASLEKAAAVIRPLAEAKGLALSVDVADGISELVSDQRRVEQVLLNLLNNAVKFTEKGSVRLECRIAGGMVETRIIDTGIGIRPEDRDKLFRPFSQIDSGLTRNHEGTGLGLAICGRLVEKLGGTIELESVFGQGSVFIVKLPLNTGGAG